MRTLFLLCLFPILLIACEPTRRTAPPLPPGVERGKTWEEASEYGYEKDIYVTPSYIAYPLKGSRNLRQALHRTYRTDACNSAPEEATARYVIGDDGQLIGFHPITALEKKCIESLHETIKAFEFFPAEHNDQSVNMMMAITFHRARL